MEEDHKVLALNSNDPEIKVSGWASVLLLLHDSKMQELCWNNLHLNAICHLLKIEIDDTVNKSVTIVIQHKFSIAFSFQITLL